MEFLGSANTIIRIFINRTRCRRCGSQFHENNFYLDPEGLIFKAKIGNRTKKPIYKRVMNGRMVVCASKEYRLDAKPFLFAICPRCGCSKKLRLPLTD